MCPPNDDTIYLMSDQPPTCGECGRRIDLNPQPVGVDEDGPIYEGDCPVHGLMFFQLRSGE